MMRRDRQVKWSNLYSFSCVRRTRKFDEEETQSFSRIIFCNQSELHRQKPFKYPANCITTTKYSFLTFLPKSIFEQFRRVANMYFLIVAVFSTTYISPFSPVTVVGPLLIVVGFTMAKEAWEDWRRLMHDRKVNKREVSVHDGEGCFVSREWRNISVGDVVKVEKDQFFPADLFVLSSSYEDGICYVETMNLDGETNLKIKRCLEATLPLVDAETMKDFKAIIRCEDPNPNLYTFVGNLEYEQQVYSLDPSQILLRDSKLRNTDYIYGVVIFTGHDSKVMQNGTQSRSKRSTIERKMDKIIYVLIALLVGVSLLSSIGFGLLTKTKVANMWYLRLHAETHDLYYPVMPVPHSFQHFLRAMILYGYIIPISLYVSLEFVKILQSKFISTDILMYDEEMEQQAQARTSNLNEDLGQVDTILTDKTGTLTCNQMDFLKCSIAGVSYGVGYSEVEIPAVEQMASETSNTHGRHSSTEQALDNDGHGFEPSEIELVSATFMDYKTRKPGIKGFNFEDDRIMHGHWVKEPYASTILMFFRILAVCHTAIPELNEETDTLSFEAESPDEGSFLVAARELGFEFYKRTQSSVFVRESYSPTQSHVEREFKILNILEFNSRRKRMSVIVRDDSGQIFLWCKGADSIIFERLSEGGRRFESETAKHLKEYGEAGLRTLVLAYRPLEESEYYAWNAEFMKAKTTVGSERDVRLDCIADLVERELILVGATALEDKLQKGVPQCIENLAQAGIKIWVLTGDKMETAINIGFACNLLRQGMKQICLSTIGTDLLSQDAKRVETESLVKQITNASRMIKLEEDPHVEFALIIDGKALTYALQDNVKISFLSLAVSCSSVLCCRVSPRQKALITRLVKDGTKKVTLAIGDGANDVGMIQEADIGVGISGVEGMQAVMASDFSIPQFRFLERLLLVHGHWCYKRIAQMICYFFYKNIVLGLTMFYFEAFTGFSGQSIYDDWYMLLHNVVLTSLPVIALGVLEQDVPSEVCLHFPALYRQGPKNLFFGWYRIIGWIVNSIYSSIVIYFLNIGIFHQQAFQEGGQSPDMKIVGTTMFTCVVWTVNLQIALMISHFTWIQHLCIWGSIVTWYLFLVAYGFCSSNGYKIFIETLAPDPMYWLATLLVVVACLIPYKVYISCKKALNPDDHHVIQEIKYCKKTEEVQDVKKSR